VSISFTRTLTSLDAASPFVGPRFLERRRGRRYRARLGANECLFGSPPAALRLLASAGTQLGLYCDPTHWDLREAIAESWRRPAREIVIAEGIDGVLGLLVRAFLEIGDIGVTSHGAYPTFDYHVRGYGGRLAYCRYTDQGTHDLDAMIDTVRNTRARLLFLANPDNPTGLIVPRATLEEFIERLPMHCVLLLDEAYVEFAPPEDVLPRDLIRPNLIRLRTFSKAFGLAGARVGYAIADLRIVDALDRIRLHFGVSRLSQEMALAALSDNEFVESVILQTEKGREHYQAIAKSAGISALPSFTNFVSLDFGTPTRAAAVAAVLDENDIFVRRPIEPPLDRLIRITVAPPDDRDYLETILLDGLADAS
jgi:histidinol-phosphate aminotransferase